MSVWLHVDRRRHDRAIPFAGVTGIWPDGSVRATSDFHVERLSYVRDPQVICPRYRLTSGAQYLADSYGLEVPEWGLRVTSRPLVSAPAHEFPIEYWSGPTEIEGVHGEREVRGFGFHERTYVFARDFELVDVLRGTLRHLSPTVFQGADPAVLADVAWEVDGFLSHGDRVGAKRHLRDRLRPSLVAITDEAIRVHVSTILDDLESALAG